MSVSAAGSTARATDPASASAGSSSRCLRGVPRPSVNAVSRSQPRHAPTSATTKVSAGGPAMAAQPCAGTPAWLIASLPQGKPPHGQRSLNASAATQQPATAGGHQRRLSSSRCAIANTAKMSAEAMASATQANQARLTTQTTSGKKKARPNTRPTVNAPRSERPDRATTSRAGLTKASGHRPNGGNAAASSSPAARLTGSAQRRRSGGRMALGGRQRRVCPARVAGQAGRTSPARPAAARPAGPRRIPWDHLRRVNGMGSRREAGNFAISVNMANRCVPFGPSNAATGGAGWFFGVRMGIDLREWPEP